MAIFVQCASCSKRFELADSFAGKRVTCKCGARIDVPMADLSSGASGSALPNPSDWAAAKPLAPLKAAPTAPRKRDSEDKLLSGYMTDTSWRKERRESASSLQGAKWILIVVGVITAAVSGVFLLMTPSMVHEEFQAERTQIIQQGLVPDDSQLEAEQQIITIVACALQFAAMSVGVAMIVCGLLIKRYPRAATTVALVLFLGSSLLFAIIDPSSLLRGLLIKILVIIALGKAMHSAYTN